MVDLNDLTMFVQVVRAGSFVEAARRLGMPANTLSRRIRRLEDQLGAQLLLQRSTRKLSLTASGSRFFDRCCASVEHLGQAVDELLGAGDVPAGRVRVAAPADFMAQFGSERVQAFLARYPQVRLEFVLDDAVSDVIAQGIDIALRSGRLPDSSLVARHACLTRPDRAEHTRWAMQGPDGDEEVEVSGPFRINTAQGLLHAALAGLGIALLSNYRVAQDVQAGRHARRRAAGFIERSHEVSGGMRGPRATCCHRIC